jgi:transposase-like protein
MKEEKSTRHFSEAFKKEKVKMIEDKQMTVVQLSRIYEVTRAAIYKWIRQYSTRISKGERIVIEKESEGTKTIKLLNRVSELERTIGQKQLQIDYLEKVLELGSAEAGFDIKKKFVSGPLNVCNPSKKS